MRGKLETFLNPKTIAIIGASNNQNKIGNILTKKLKKFKGNIVPINPKEKIIEGEYVYKKVTDYPHKIDLAVIATPKKTVKKILTTIKEKNIKHVIIITAGFAEEKRKKDQEYLRKWVKENEINVLGPNCFGIAHPNANINLTFANKGIKNGSTVFISQSGALGSFIMDNSINLKAFISLGNMIDLNFSDFIEYFSQDKQVKKIILYIETLNEGRRFIQACKNSKKEIIAVKAGKTKKGKKATLSHTGSIGSSYDIYKGAFKQAKIKITPALTTAFGLKKENIPKTLSGKTVAIITNAGGAGALLTDELKAANFKVFGPKDILGTATPNDYARALHRLKKKYDNIVIIFTPQTMSNAEGVAKAIIKARQKNITALFLGNKSIKKAVALLKEHTVAVFTRGV